MKNSINLLDCTLRDGGYVNEWNFGYKNILYILNNLISGGVRHIELGYLKNGSFNDNVALFSNLDEVNRVLINLESIKQKITFYLMVNFGDFEVKKLPLCESIEFDIAIRFAFHLEDINYIETDILSLFSKGFKILLQPMLTKIYNPSDLKKLVTLSNKYSFNCVYIVDSFGNLAELEIRNIGAYLNNHLNPSIGIGLHLHDNLQNSLVRAVSFIDQKYKRNIYIDSSVSGVGRGAGNLYTEILADILNSKYGANFSIIYFLKLIDEYFELLKKEYGWGYSMSYFLSSKYGCHPNYASFFSDRKQFSVETVDELLKNLNDSQKIRFSKDYAEDYLDNFMSSYSKKTSSSEILNIFKNKRILLLGPGKSIIKNKNLIHRKIREKDLLVISLNFVSSEIGIDYAFFSNEKRFETFKDSSCKFILSSNIPCEDASLVIDIENLKNGFVKSTNSFLMFLNLMVSFGYKEVYSAGIDGYDKNFINNYFYSHIGQITKTKELEKRNNHLIKNIKKLNKEISIVNLTKSKILNF